MKGGRFQKHSYDYDPVCLTNRHLNPDLSQEWVIGFLTANDAVPTIEASIREHMDGFANKVFCYSFWYTNCGYLGRRNVFTGHAESHSSFA